VALTLTGCVTFGTSSKQFPPPPIPADIRVCFEQIVAAPKKGAMTKKQVLALIASLKLSEAQKVACGKRLIAFYEAFSHKDK
jgi:hypothetical protein